MGLSERKRKSFLRILKGRGATKMQNEAISDARSIKVMV
jgi:hypothetical protein